MKILQLMCSLVLVGCAATSETHDTTRAPVPSEGVITAIINDAVNPKRNWGEFRGKPKYVLLFDQVHSRHRDKHSLLSKTLSPEWLAELQLIDDFEHLDSWLPDNFDTITINFRDMRNIGIESVEVLVGWSFSRRVCGSNWLQLMKHGGRWRVAGSKPNSIC